jgi:accessory gene regulator protein AgrB
MVLVVASFPLPYGYYTFTRIVTCLACIALAYTANGPHPGSRIWATLFVLIAIVFNPLIPVYLKKQTWMYIDGGASAVILAHLLTVRGLRS